MELNEKILITPIQAMQLLNVGRNAIYKLLNEKDFPVVIIGSKKYINRALLEEWANKKCNKM